MRGGSLDVRAERWEDAIYLGLGRAVVAFQSVENRLREVAVFALSPGCTIPNVPSVAAARYSQLPRIVAEAVHEFLKRERVDEITSAAIRELEEREGATLREQFLDRLDDALDRCRRLGEQRNQLVHSAYVHVDSAGGLVGILRSDLRVEKKTVGPAQEWLEEGCFDAFLAEAGAVYFELGMLRLQLIHWQGSHDRQNGDTQAGDAEPGS